jgi:hypothetical protein
MANNETQSDRRRFRPEILPIATAAISPMTKATIDESVINSDDDHIIIRFHVSGEDRLKPAYRDGATLHQSPFRIRGRCRRYFR